MSLLDDLRKIADFPISHVPTISEALPILGGLIAYVEHGPTVLEAADKGAQELSDLLAGHHPADHPVHENAPAVPEVPGPVVTPPPPGPAPASSSVDESELRAQIASLEQQLQTQLANQQRTTTTVEPVVAPPAPEAL